MNNALRKPGGVIGIALSWGVAWGAVFATIGLIVGIVDPAIIDQGEDPIGVGRIGFAVGFVSGAIYGLILSFVGHRKSILDLALVRVAFWGALASATWPLLTHVDDSMVIMLCPLGAICASVAVAIARGVGPDHPERPRLLRIFGRMLAGPLRAACAN